MPAAADPEVREELYTSFFVSRRIVFFCFFFTWQPASACSTQLISGSFYRKKEKKTYCEYVFVSFSLKPFWDLVERPGNDQSCETTIAAGKEEM